MRILFDYTCGCGTTFEELVERDSRDSVTCPSCGSLAKRQLSCPRLDTRLGVDPDSFPTLGDKWERNRKQHQQIEEARKREHGA